MNGDNPLASAAFGLSSAATWGVGDFCGGLATRRARVLTVVFLSQGIGLAVLIALALLTREPPPSAPDLAWGAAAGLAGLVGLSALIVLKERLIRHQIIGVALALVAIPLIVAG